MGYAGDLLSPEKIAEKLWSHGWRDVELVQMLATVLGESGGYTEAWNDNLDERGRLKSRDVGLAQINIRAKDVGTPREHRLRDPDYNLARARELFDTRETLRRRRRFNPWYAYTKGWALFPNWWIMRTKETAKAKKLPREWVPTGLYLHRAVVGVANFYARKFDLEPRPFVTHPERPDRPPFIPHDDGRRPKENNGQGVR